MGSVHAHGRSAKRKRRRLALVLSLAALGVGLAGSARLWVRGAPADRHRLDLLFDAWNEFNAKRYDRATAILDHRTALVEPIALDWMLRAQIAESQGGLDQALEYLKHINDSDSIGARAWLKAGQIEKARHNARSAEAAFRRSVELDHNQTQAYRELVYLYALERRKAECDDLFRAFARLVTFDDVLAFAWAQNDCEIWDPNEAIPVLGAIVANDPADRFSRLALATNYRLMKAFEQAVATLEPLPDSDPDARAIRVQIAIDRADFDGAARLVQDGPSDHPRLNSLRGRLAMQAGETRKASVYFRAALDKDPRDRDAIQGLGVALQRVGDPRAKEYLQIASRYDHLKREIVRCGNVPKIEPEVFAQLGEICESLERPDQARVWYQVAIGRDPLDARAQQALTHLDQAAKTPEVISH
jgi:tetratricopeptide (TPR) repeat protein